MGYYRIGFNKPTLQALVLPIDSTPPNGFRDIGTYFLPVDPDPNDNDLHDVHFTYVQELCYKQDELDMQIVKIIIDPSLLAPIPNPDPPKSVFGNGIWDDSAIWDDTHIWKDHP